ncbi:MAG: hypothetical protein V4760_15000 [Bdellovibrionota bacterium]
MRRQPIVIRPRAKAIAIEADSVQQDRLFALIHLILALLTPFLIMALTGCIAAEDGAPVDYGPQVSVASINEAIMTPIEGMDPLNIKLGEFRAIENSQEIVGIPGRNLLSAQGVTITARDEKPDHIDFTAVITDVEYKNDGTFDKVSREGPVCVSKVYGACGEDPIPSPGSTAIKAFSSPVAYIENTVKALSSTLTFHRLKTSTAIVGVPAEVAARPNCGGVANCQMTIHKIGFDQVEWENGKATKIHVDVVMSNSVPYLSNQLQACFTGLVAVGNTSDVLVKQCSTVFDFRFDAP